MRRLHLVVPVLAILAASGNAACGGGDSGGPSFNLAGDWVGGASGQGVTIQISFTLQDQGGTLTGTGTLSTTLVNCAPTVSGNRHGTAVTLSFGCQGYQPLGFTGDANSPTLVNGTISGSGFTPLSMDFIKQ